MHILCAVLSDELAFLFLILTRPVFWICSLNLDLVVADGGGIQFSEASVAKTTIDELGSELSVPSGVTLSFPQGSLPPDTAVSMTVFEVDQRKCFENTTYSSPLVAIEAGSVHRSSKPLELSLPLESHPGLPVHVIASFTSIFERPEWVELPSTDFVVRDGCVVVFVNRLCLFQAQRGMKIETHGEDMHFSVSYRQRGDDDSDEYDLRIACSTNLDYCYEAVGSCQLAHVRAETRYQSVPFFGTMHVEADLESSNGSILQLWSALDGKERDGRLSHSFPIYPVAPGERNDAGMLVAREGDTTTWTVRLQSPIGVGRGSLHAYSVLRTKTAEGEVVEQKDRSGGKQVCFTIPFPSVSGDNYLLMYLSTLGA